jgi:hypothetical protein
MQTSTIHTLRQRGLGMVRVTAVLGGLVATSFFGTVAEARVPDGATGSQAEYCRGIQNEYDTLVQELALARSIEEQRRISRQIAHLQELWYHRCKPAFGNLAEFKLNPAVIQTTGTLTQADGGATPPPNVIVRSPLTNAVMRAD